MRAQDLVAAVPTQGTHYVVTLFTVHVIQWNTLHVDILTYSLFHVSLYAEVSMLFILFYFL